MGYSYLLSGVCSHRLRFLFIKVREMKNALQMSVNRCIFMLLNILNIPYFLMPTQPFIAA